MAKVMRAICMVMQLNLSSVRCLGLRRSFRFLVDLGVSSGLCMTTVSSEHQTEDKPAFVDVNIASLSEDVAVIGAHVARRSTRFFIFVGEQKGSLGNRWKTLGFGKRMLQGTRELVVNRFSSLSSCDAINV